ncbi:hypothetical protein GCM10023333_40220 [Ferrimonas pelagia]|uniref:PepSY domain-containing protein n=2 Tax=Ferrimonas pelagia TaxID=1177826 RepID=A0ABP9FG10_9GAMM
MIIAAVLAATTAVAAPVIASDGEHQMKGERGERAHYMKGERGERGKHQMKGKRGHDRAQMQQRFDREFSQEEIQTLAEARLIMKGNDNLQIGAVEPTAEGYTISIVTKAEGALVETREVARNGMPMERYTKALEHKAKREARKAEKSGQ